MLALINILRVLCQWDWMNLHKDEIILQYNL